MRVVLTFLVAFIGSVASAVSVVDFGAKGDGTSFFPVVGGKNLEVKAL